jgi:putative ABC transport system substrate-binding protein
LTRLTTSPPSPSASRPSSNVTGVFLDIPELSGKQVGLLKEIVPRLSRIAIFGIPDLNALQFKATETVARALNVKAEIMEVRVAEDFGPAIEAARAANVEAGVLLSSPLVYLLSRHIGELAIAKRLPLISLFGAFPKTAVYWLTGRMRGRCSEDAGVTSGRSCRAPSRVICRSSGRRSLIWRSI